MAEDEAQSLNDETQSLNDEAQSLNDEPQSLKRKKRNSSGSEPSSPCLRKNPAHLSPFIVQTVLHRELVRLLERIRQKGSEYYFLQRGGAIGDFEYMTTSLQQSDELAQFMQILFQEDVRAPLSRGPNAKAKTDIVGTDPALSILNKKISSSNYQSFLDILRQPTLAPSIRHTIEKKILSRIAYLKKCGMWSASRIPKCLEPSRPKTLCDLALEECQWLSTDFACERKKKASQTKKINQAVLRHFATKSRQLMMQEKETVLMRKRLAALVSKEVQSFWKNINKVLRYKQKLETSAERKEALKEHLRIVVEQTQKYIAKLALDSDATNTQTHGTAPEIESASRPASNIELKDDIKDAVITLAKEACSFQPSGQTLDSTKVKTNIPFLLKHSLREYQHVGLDWMARMYDNKLNGILADEMGLGKTIQTIAFLAHLACNKGVWGPFLIVVPTSVMLNWELEFKKWCPAFKILTYYGTAKQRKEKRRGWTMVNAFHVCITSYKLAVRDSLVLRRLRWKVLILDEAQQIKNFKSQRWQCLLNFTSSRRFLLTGTPLQNSLMELWSFLHFLMPQIFVSHEEFKLWFSNPVTNMIEGNRSINEKLVSQLHQVLRPFILRRLKSEVEKQMPKKFEHIVTAKLSKRQRFLYDDFINNAKTQETIRAGAYVSVVGVLMQLRKVCNHPDLFEPRQVVSPFSMEHIEYKVPRMTENLLDFKVPTSHCTIDFCSAESKMSSFDCLRARFLSANRCAWIDDWAWPPEDEDLKPTFIPPPLSQREKVIFDYFESPTRMTLDGAQMSNLNTIRMPASPSVDETDQTTGMECDPIRRMLLRREERMRNRLELFARTQCAQCFRSLFKPVYGTDLRLVADCTKHATVDSLRCCSGTGGQFLTNLPRLTEATSQLIRQYRTDVSSARIPIYIPAAYSKREIAVSIEFDSDAERTLIEEIPEMPLILFPDRHFLQYDSGKLQVLKRLLCKLQTERHRVLIFTQMTQMLDILEIFLSWNNMTYLRLDGTTKIEKRQALVETFNQDQRIFCFILSTRSGGIGVNLTGADTVIFYDSDWNPTSDAQAQDRCHRIGQTRDVHIYRLVSEYTVEENIIKKAGQKRILGNVAIDGIAASTVYEKQSIRSLFAMLPYSDEIRSLDADVSQEQFVRALESVEDQTDVDAFYRLRDEVEKADEEFPDDGSGDVRLHDSEEDSGPENSNKKIEALYEELSEVEKYALRFAEQHQHLFGFSRAQLSKQLELDLIKRECQQSRLLAMEAGTLVTSSSEDEQLPNEDAERLLAGGEEKVQYNYQGYHNLSNEISRILGDCSIDSDVKSRQINDLVSCKRQTGAKDVDEEASKIKREDARTSTNKSQGEKRKRGSAAPPSKRSRQVTGQPEIEQTNNGASHPFEGTHEQQRTPPGPPLLMQQTPILPIIHNSNVININPTVNAYYVPSSYVSQQVVAPRQGQQWPPPPAYTVQQPGCRISVSLNPPTERNSAPVWLSPPVVMPTAFPVNSAQGFQNINLAWANVSFNIFSGTESGERNEEIIICSQASGSPEAEKINRPTTSEDCRRES